MTPDDRKLARAIIAELDGAARAGEAQRRRDNLREIQARRRLPRESRMRVRRQR